MLSSRFFSAFSLVPSALVVVVAAAQMPAAAGGPQPLPSTDAAISHITRRLMASGEGEVSSRKIGELVMDELKKLDQVAYVRFASVYRQFEDVNAFREEIERLEKQLTPEARRQQLDFLDEDK